MTPQPAAIPRLRRAGNSLRGSPLGAARRRYERSCERTAREVRAADLDRDLLDQTMEHVRPLLAGDPYTLFGAVRVSQAMAVQLRHALELGRESQRVRNAFVQANLRLVVTIARRFNFGDIPLNDLIQEGNIGLIKAVGRYDHRRGFRFSTYASWWIRHAVTRAIADKGRLVRVPVHMLSTVHKVTRMSRELQSTLGRAPTAKEIAQSAALEVGKVQQILEHLPSRSLSLDSKVADEDDRRFVDMVSDEDSSSPADAIGNQQVYAQVRQIIRDLQPMELDILQRRFGLVDGQEHTLVEIGESYALSRERIRQIQERALAKIRRALRRRKAI